MRHLTFSVALLAALGGAPMARAAETQSLPGSLVAANEGARAPLSPEQLLSCLAGDLQARFKLVGDLQIDFVNPWTPPNRLAREWKVSVVEYPSTANSSMVVRFRAYADSVQLEESTVILRASLWRDAWFAREPLAAGCTLDSPLIEPRRIDSFRMRDAIPVGSPEPDLIVTRSVEAGAMLSWHDVGHRPLVRKGEIVDVTASTGLLRVTMKAVALQSGALGDIVTVRNPESLKTIPALVVGDDRVEVRL